jgi:hypothetical protein
LQRITAMTRRFLPMTLVLPFVIFFSAPAFAQAHAGVRVGVSADPDQFFFGGHVETRPLIEHLSFRPNVELGFGDDVTVIGLNFEFAYSIPMNRQPWRVYLGAGPAANIVSGSGRRDDGDDVVPGFNILVGIQHTRGLFAELKIGAIDSPELKFTVGYAFK